MECSLCGKTFKYDRKYLASFDRRGCVTIAPLSCQCGFVSSETHFMRKSAPPNEINKFYHKKHTAAASNSSIVKGLKWNLSKSYSKNGKEICEQCNQYATQNLYGLGPGVYPVNIVPKGHDGCHCFLTDVLYEGDELIEKLKENYKIK
jgi:hypothetical protein